MPVQGITNYDPAKRYFISVDKAVTIMPKLVWRPGQTIQTDGTLIATMAAMPEYADCITVINEVPADQVI